MKNIIQLSGICVILSLILTGCNAKVSTQITKTYPAIDSTQNIHVLRWEESLPENTEVIGMVEVGDNGLTGNSKCTYEAVIEKAKEEARKAGGNAIKITKHKIPDVISSCHRITADILRIENADSYLFGMMPKQTADSNYATLNIFIISKGINKGIERVAKICMPMLLFFGLFLVVKAYSLKAGDNGAICDGTTAIDFLWTPDLDSLSNPKIWLAAAGQVFFTLSLGMGAIQTYASYLKRDEDIALSSMTSAFTNEFTEIILGSAIIIPIAVGYLGIDKVVELAQTGGFGLGFRTMPYLFGQWGDILSALAGLAFFGLLFFAAITSSLSTTQPFVAFLSNSYNWSQKSTSYTLGAIILIIALPCIFFFEKGVFDQYDFWGGTVALFLFATIEAIAFSWVMGIEKGWKLINYHADMQIPKFFKYVLKYVTPTMLITIFLAALFKPKNDDWSLISLKGWPLDDSAIIAELTHQGISADDPNIAYIDGARIGMAILLVLVCVLIWHASYTREQRILKERREGKL